MHISRRSQCSVSVPYTERLPNYSEWIRTQTELLSGINPSYAMIKLRDDGASALFRRTKLLLYSLSNRVVGREKSLTDCLVGENQLPREHRKEQSCHTSMLRFSTHDLDRHSIREDARLLKYLVFSFT